MWGAVTSYMVQRVCQSAPVESITSGYAAPWWAYARLRAVKHAAIKRVLGLGVVTGLGYAAYRAYRARVPASPDGGSWEAAPFPFPPIPRPAPATATPTATRPTAVPDFLERSIDPLDGECPDSHPVKGKLSSGIYHQPGGLNYTRTRADRCYLDPTAAESDGLRPSKR